MTAASPVAEFWSLDQRIGRLHFGPVTAQIDLSRPHLGLHAIRLASTPLDARLLALLPSDSDTWPAGLVDAYIRSQDLIATYAAVDTWPYAPQIYWGVDPANNGSGVVASLSLVVSIQTHLLDTQPRIEVRSRLCAEELLLVRVTGDDLLVDSHVTGEQQIEPWSSSCGLVWRLAGGTMSYAEIMPTSDFRRLAIEHDPGGEIQSRWELFAEFLEKGVIRRARMQSIFLPRENDVQLAAEFCQAIERRPLPLTT